MRKIYYLIALFILIFGLISCGPKMSIVYIGGMHNTAFHDSALFVDGEFIGDLEEGVLTKEVTLTPGFHSFAFVTKDGKRREFKIEVPPGENGLEYFPKKRLWVWNYKEYTESPSGVTKEKDNGGQSLNW